MSDNDNYYMSFKDIYGKETDEKYRPSLKNKSNNKITDSNDSQLKPTQQYGEPSVKRRKIHFFC